MLALIHMSICFLAAPFFPDLVLLFGKEWGSKAGFFGLADEVTWAGLHRGGNTLQHLVFKLSFAACIYHIRRVQNTRIFQGIFF